MFIAGRMIFKAVQDYMIKELQTYDRRRNIYAMNVIAADQSQRSGQVSSLTDLTFPKRQMATSGSAELKQDGASDKGSNGSTTGNDISKDFQLHPHSDTRRIIWFYVILEIWTHALSLYSLIRLPQYRLFTLALGAVYYVISILGVTAGAHRLWTHRTYKATLPLKILLMLFQCVTFQESLFKWCRNHRIHHKFSDTDADPHNSRRGFFFSHIGWFMMTGHQDVEKNRRTIFMDDMLKDPVVTFQRRNYLPMAITFSFILPTLIPWYFCGETLWNAYCVATLRYCLALHAVLSINSFAHMYGWKPYDKQMCACENVTTNFFTLGEGFHNYHHAFPHDYSTSEFGMKLNLTTAFINLMAVLGQAYDLRVADKTTIEARKRRTGELSGVKNAAL